MNKFGTALCLSSALLVSGVAQAAWQGNWLIGVSGGYAESEGELELTMFHPLGFQTNFNKDFENTGFIGGIFGGYQAVCNRWLWGLELNVDWQDLDSDNNFAFTDFTDRGWAVSSNYDRDVVVGLTGRLGYQISRCFMPYIRVGAEISNNDLNFSAIRDPNNLPVSSDVFFALNGSRHVTRFVGGIGAEMPVPVSKLAGLSIRVEYDYHAGGRVIEVNGVASDNATFVATSMSPRVNSAKASLVWNFI